MLRFRPEKWRVDWKSINMVEMKRLNLESINAGESRELEMLLAEATAIETVGWLVS